MSEGQRGMTLGGIATSMFESIFYRRAGALAKLVNVGGMLLLFGLGLYIWAYFFSRGDFAFDFLDWAEITGPRYAVWQDAAEKGQLPLHTNDTATLRGVTNRYLAIPDTPYSPQFFLLGFMQLGQFVFWDTLLFYTLGFGGLLLFYRKYRLSLFTFALLFFLFNFNGHIVSHFAAGHAAWTGYFLLPVYAYLLLQLIETQRAGWGWVIGLSLTLLVILLQGHYHQYLWCLMFLGLVGVVNPKVWKPVLLGGLFSVLVSLPRLLPPALILEGITHKPLGGFASLTDLVGSMIVLRDPDRAIGPLPSVLYPLSYWEVDHFIGLLGLALLVWFGVIVPLRQERGLRSMQVQVLLPSLVMVLLSIGSIYAEVVLRVAPVPPLTGERVTSRFFIVPMVLVLVLAVIYLQRELERVRPQGWVLGVSLVGAGVVFAELYQHLTVWRIRYLDGLTYIIPKVPFDPARHTIANQADPAYMNLLVGGGAVALLTLAFLVVMAVRERK